MLKDEAKIFLQLTDELVQIFHMLRACGEKLHSEIKLTSAQRGVINDLYDRGPQTVPQLARKRYSSRQHIQTIIDELLQRELVTKISNENHLTSHLIKLTAQGEKVVLSIKKREIKFLQQTQLPSILNMKRTCSVIKSMRNSLKDYLEK